MASLYELTQDFKELFDSYEAITEMEFEPDGKGGFLDDDGNPVDPAAARAAMAEAWFDTLDGMEGELTAKAENVAVYIKNIKAEYEAIEAEKKRLEARLRTKKATAERMKKYLMDCLETARLSKIDTPRASVSLKNNPASLHFTDECLFIGWAENHDREDLLKYTDPAPRKDVIKKLIKSGEEIPYTELVQEKSIMIK